MILGFSFAVIYVEVTVAPLRVEKITNSAAMCEIDEDGCICTRH